MNKYRTHNCSELRESEINKNVSLSGWLHRKRDHGNLLFIDLRDHYGLTQCVIENKNKYFPILEKARPETVLKINGKVVKRSKGTENPDLMTGEIEVSVAMVEILSEAKELPIPVFKSRFSVPLVLFTTLPFIFNTDSGFDFSKIGKKSFLFSITHWVTP